MSTVGDIEAVHHLADGIIRSKLSRREIAMLRIMASGGRSEVAQIRTNGDVTIGTATFRDPDFSAALAGKLLEQKCVARTGDDGPYFLTSKGTAAAFSPQFSRQTWLGIGLLAAILSVIIVIVLGRVFPPTAQSELPIGSIIAWHRDLRGAPQELPSGWVECNGPMKSDPKSPVDMSEIPDLNREKRFLRGGINSGTTEDYATAMPKTPFTLDKQGNHTHAFITNPENDHESGPYLDHLHSSVGVNNLKRNGEGWIASAGRHAHVIDGGDEETRSKNMSVVWIIRVK